MERNLQKNGLINVALLLLIGVAGFVVARYANSLAGLVSVVFIVVLSGFDAGDRSEWPHSPIASSVSRFRISMLRKLSRRMTLFSFRRVKTRETVSIVRPR